MEVRAPGRVNLIGEHTDYSDGWCLPVAIDRECRIRRTPNAEPVVRARSAELAGTVEVPLDGTVPPATPRWGRFVAGAVAGGPRRAATRSRAPTSPCTPPCPRAPACRPRPRCRWRWCSRCSRPTRPSAPTATRWPASRSRPRSRPPACRAGCSTRWRRCTAAPATRCCSTAGRLAVEPVPIPPELAILVVHSGIERELADSEYAARRGGVRGGRGPDRGAGAAGRHARPRWPTTRSPGTSSPRTHGCSSAPTRSRAGRPRARSARSCSPATPASATTSACRAPSSTCSSSASSPTARSAPGSPAPASAAASSASPRPAIGAAACLAATLADYRDRTGRPATGFPVTPADGAGDAPPDPARPTSPPGGIPCSRPDFGPPMQLADGSGRTRGHRRGEARMTEAPATRSARRMTRATWWVFGVALVWLSAHALGLLGPLAELTLPAAEHRRGRRDRGRRPRSTGPTSPRPWYVAHRRAWCCSSSAASPAPRWARSASSPRAAFHRPGPHHDPRLLPRRGRLLRHRARPPARPRQRDRHAARRRGRRARGDGARLALLPQPLAAQALARCRCA